MLLDARQCSGVSVETLCNSAYVCKQVAIELGDPQNTDRPDLMHENTPAEFDEYDQSYNDAMDRALAFSGLKLDFFTRVKVEYFVELLESLAVPVSRIDMIDVGCGIGNSHPLLKRHVGRLTGVDVSRACITQAVANNPENDYKAYDGLNLPYPAASFDVASAVCVFHHVPIPHRLPLARDIRRILKPKGLFVLFEHNPFNPFTRHVVNNCTFDKNAILLRSNETELLFEQAGFQNIRSNFILAIPAIGRTLRKVDQLFSRLPLGAQYYTFGSG